MKKLSILFLIFISVAGYSQNLQLPFGVKVVDDKPLNFYYFKSDNTPWSSTAEVNAAIPTGVRHIGLTVLIGTTEYWYSPTTANGNLVVKSDGSGMTNPMTTQGDIISGGASGTPTRLGIGADTTVLGSSGTSPVWIPKAWWKLGGTSTLTDNVTIDGSGGSYSVNFTSVDGFEVSANSINLLSSDPTDYGTIRADNDRLALRNSSSGGGTSMFMGLNASNLDGGLYMYSEPFPTDETELRLSMPYGGAVELYSPNLNGTTTFTSNLILQDLTEFYTFDIKATGDVNIFNYTTGTGVEITEDNVNIFGNAGAQIRANTIDYDFGGSYALFEAPLRISPTTNPLRFSSDGVRWNIISSTSPATTDRTWTIPDLSSNQTFVGLTGTQALTNKSVNGVTLETGGSATQYLSRDGTYTTPAGGGNVSKVGTPADNQVGVWTGDGTIEGTGGLTYNGTALSITGNITLSGTVDGIDVGTDVAANTAKVGFTDELAQDAVGAMVDGTLVYTDGTPLLSRAALTGAITASEGSNTTALGSFTVAQLSTAISDANISGTNTGDQTSIVGITGSLSEFNTALTGADFATGGGTATGTNTGDQSLANTSDATSHTVTLTGGTSVQLIEGSNITLTTGGTGGAGTVTIASTGGAYTDEQAQDAIGAMVDASLTYVDGTPLLQRAALTGAVTATAGSNATVLGSFTKSSLDGAVSDGNVLYVGDVTSNATHTGEVTGSTALTVDKTAITNKTLVTAVGTDHVLIADASDADNLKKVLVSDFLSGGGIGGSTGATDNSILRADGTGGSTLQNSAFLIDDAGDITQGLTASTTGSTRTYSLAGTATNIGLDFIPKGTGEYRFYGDIWGAGGIVAVDDMSSIGRMAQVSSGSAGNVSFKGFKSGLDITETKFEGADGTVTFVHGSQTNLVGGDGYSSSGNGDGGDVFIQSGLRRAAGAGTDGDIVLDDLLGDIVITQTPTTSVSTSDHILIRDVSTGDVEKLGIGSGLSISGNDLIATGGGGGLTYAQVKAIKFK